MKIAFRKLTHCCAVLAFAGIATAPLAANDPPKPQPGAGNAAVGKAQECARMKKRIADYEAATAKGGKGPGAETIKKDIAWYNGNCK